MDGFDVEIAGDATGATRKEDIDALRSALTDGGVRFNELLLMRKSMDAPPGEALGFFKLALDQGKDWAPVVIAYLVGRMGRKVSITVGDTKIEATSKAEVEKLIPLVEELRAKKAKKR
mgnify:CR=1 FL=1